MWTLKSNRAAVVTFLCGLAVTSLFGPVPRGRPDKTTVQPSSVPCPPVAAAPVTDATEPEGWGYTAAGQKWKNLHNGSPLPPGDGTLSEQELADAKVVALSSGRILVSAGDSLYMVGDWRKIAWTYTESQRMIDFAYVEATGVVCGTAGDNTMFILDAWTGQLLLRESRNGRAGYGAVLAYGKDQCLIMDEFSGYRENEDSIPPMSDGIMAWRGTKKLWHRDVPPDAEVQVRGDRVFAVTKTASRILFEEIEVPKGSR